MRSTGPRWSLSVPDLLLSVLHLGRQPLDRTVQLVQLLFAFAEVLTLLGHCSLHLLALQDV